MPTTRRRCLTILAGLAVLPITTATPPIPEHRWTGRLLGANAELRVIHPDRGTVETTLVAALDEIERLEDVFSLHRPASELSRLNRNGYLDCPSPDLLLALQAARQFSDLSNGAFDITVQPLWAAYAAHFAAHPDDRAGPDVATIAASRALIGWRDVGATTARVAFARPGMAITLNGIAQGIVTDRIAGLLVRNGLNRILVDLGEHRGIGAGPRGTAWQVGLRDPRAPARLVTRVDLGTRALSTSGGYGTPFSHDGRHHHLFDPASGRSASGWASVTVIAATATEADGWSTALAAMPAAEGLALLDRRRDELAGALLIGPDGAIHRFGLI
ncbi:MAG: FAD:protein FMN transferase [Alphaproteobacteria bacterium]|nr:FAD:protein FMN transferase [Alphaproteobacteria bacterium]